MGMSPSNEVFPSSVIFQPSLGAAKPPSRTALTTRCGALADDAVDAIVAAIVAA